MSPKRMRVAQFGQALISDSAAITSEMAFSSSITLYFNLYRQFSGSLMPASPAPAQPAGVAELARLARGFCTAAGVAKAFGARPHSP